jgi:hypothetical protein
MSLLNSYDLNHFNVMFVQKNIYIHCLLRDVFCQFGPRDVRDCDNDKEAP